jgi:hypothetical protein
MPKIQYNKSQYTITISKELIEQSKLQKGDVVTINFNERGNLEIIKVKK